tara:strand:+ start:700 stop:1047 length:348 start_codon:yes stop_codon:yes gene_type:complete
MKQLELEFKEFYENRTGKGEKPSEPNETEIRMPSYEEGIGTAKRFVDVWVIYSDYQALDNFYQSLQIQFRIFCNISDRKEMQKRTDWIFACEKLIADARKTLKEKHKQFIKDRLK